MQILNICFHYDSISIFDFIDDYCCTVVDLVLESHAQRHQQRALCVVCGPGPGPYHRAYYHRAYIYVLVHYILRSKHNVLVNINSYSF